MISRTLLLALLTCALALSADAADKRFLAIGDSITVGLGDNGISCSDDTGGYPPRLRTRLAARGIGATFSNHGVCGERTAAGVSRIDGVLATGGDVIIIMEGTNDVSIRVGYETILFNLKVMALKAASAGVEPVLASLVPRGPGSGADQSNDKTSTIGDELRIIAAESGWAFADPFNALFSLPSFFESYYADPYHPNATGYGIVADSMLDAAANAAMRTDVCSPLPAGPCTASDTALCLNQGRFRIKATWKNFSGDPGEGRALPQTDDTGAFFFFDPQNVEIVIKVLDGREINNHFWVFYGALSNVEYRLAVQDTETGQCKVYFNPLGTFASTGDTAAFFEPGLEPPP